MLWIAVRFGTKESRHYFSQGPPGRQIFEDVNVVDCVVLYRYYLFPSIGMRAKYWIVAGVDHMHKIVVVKSV